MKIAITGKGGVGKSTIAALLAKTFSANGHKVLAIDADPDMNLATILGIPDSSTITPIIELKELIAERTETNVNQPAPMFKLNPKVDDIPDKYCLEYQGIKLVVMGTVCKGGGGCACPENAFMKQLLSHIVLDREEVVIMDMEAGIEHLGRGTAIGVDQMIVVVEPSQASLDTAMRIKELANDLRLKKLGVIGNKIHDENDKDFITAKINDLEILGFIEYADVMRKLNTNDVTLFSIKDKIIDQIENIITKIN